MSGEECIALVWSLKQTQMHRRQLSKINNMCLEEERKVYTCLQTDCWLVWSAELTFRLHIWRSLARRTGAEHTNGHKWGVGNELTTPSVMLGGSSSLGGLPTSCPYLSACQNSQPTGKLWAQQPKKFKALLLKLDLFWLEAMREQPVSAAGSPGLKPPQTPSKGFENL